MNKTRHKRVDIIGLQFSWVRGNKQTLYSNEPANIEIIHTMFKLFQYQMDTEIGDFECFFDFNNLNKSILGFFCV